MFTYAGPDGTLWILSGKSDASIRLIVPMDTLPTDPFDAQGWKSLGYTEEED